MAGADLVRLVRWAFRALGVVVITLVLATCTDNPVGPGKGGVAYLRLQPVFDVYSRVAPLTLDRVRIRVIRPPTSVLADVSQPFSPTATTVQLSVPVRLERTSEDLEIHLEMYAGTILPARAARSRRSPSATRGPAPTSRASRSDPATPSSRPARRSHSPPTRWTRSRRR
jgi:hypothetical protein